jgi:GT2 family glycosyltransferase
VTVTAVVVTWNRCALLRECLAALNGQTRPPDRILVVDNASTDGTPALLRDAGVDVLRLPENVGGAGGFHAGMEAARDGADWLWLVDDDTIARPDSLERLLAGAARAPEPPSLLASRVEWSDGRAHPMNMPIVRRRDVAAMYAAGERGLLPLRAATFVSLLVSTGAIARHGLPRKAFFFQADDIELTARILRREPGYCVPDSVVEHRTKAPHDALSDPDGRRFYYHARNTLQMLRGNAWSASEKPALAWLVLESAVRYVQANRASPGSFRTVGKALLDGARPL